MKRLRLLFIVLMLCTFIAACTSTSNPANSSQPVNLITPTQKSAQTEITTPKDSDFASLIPIGWHILDTSALVEGDLNNDGITDKAAVIEGKSNNNEAASRSLIIALGNKDNTYTISINAGNVILRADEGGVFGDPFENITINRGSILVNHYGGSNWRWYNSYRFRFQDNGWYLIGATTGSYFTGKPEEETMQEMDYNLLTGDFIEKKPNNQGKQEIIKGNRGKKALVKLKDFDIRSGDTQF